MINVLCATKDPARGPKGMEHMPGEYLKDWRITWCSAPGWAKASNELLAIAAAEGEDALFLDDDITLLPETFANWARWLPLADAIGFRLVQDGRTVSAGYSLHPTGLLLPNARPEKAAYMAHVTTSAIYIKHAVLAAGIRFPVWPGVHSEDVAFTYDVWLAGFKVLYVPNVVEHAMHPSGIGSTKAHEDGLTNKLAENKRLLDQWCEEKGVMAAVREGVIPIGRREVVS